MSNHVPIAPGTRVRITAPLSDDDAGSLPVGTLGTVTRHRNLNSPFEQVDVDWDNGCRLMLVPEDAPSWAVTGEQAVAVVTAADALAEGCRLAVEEGQLQGARRFWNDFGLGEDLIVAHIRNSYGARGANWLANHGF